jgi:hypothetical protein
MMVLRAGVDSPPPPQARIAGITSKKSRRIRLL